MNTHRRRRVLIVQPYVTRYRVPFFRQLTADLAAHGVELTVAHGAPYGGLPARGDAAVLDGAVRLSQRVLHLGPRALVWRRLQAHASCADVVVLEQAMHNLDSYPLLLDPRTSPSVALWGHGRTFNRSTGMLSRAAKRCFTRRADWFFSYTRGGADHLVADGFPADRVTVVNNATDTAPLRAAREDVTGEQAARFAADHGLVPERTVLFLGSLDASKRIAFLLQAVQHAARLLPGFTLLVAGDGPQRPMVEAAAAASGSVVYLGPVFDRQRALLGSVSRLMLMPGMVGLCAVDSFALRTPLVTTHWPLHSPEFEYLQDGRNSLIAAGDPEGYAEGVVRALSDPALLERLRQGCVADADRYTIEGMSRRFADGVLAMCAG
jgi:glycosyltransferase involved in cell wall biosynthesis